MKVVNIKKLKRFKSMNNLIKRKDKIRTLVNMYYECKMLNLKYSLYSTYENFHKIHQTCRFSDLENCQTNRKVKNDTLWKFEILI